MTDTKDTQELIVEYASKHGLTFWDARKELIRRGAQRQVITEGKARRQANAE